MNGNEKSMKTKVAEYVIDLVNNPDTTVSELAEDVVKKALKYVSYRVNWLTYSNEQRMNEDGFRTSAHNVFMDSLNILFRYMDKGCEENKFSSWALGLLSKYDRKDFGDIAAEIVYLAAIRMR